MKSIIKVEGLSKQYRIGEGKNSYSTLRDAIAGAVRAPLKRVLRNGNANNTIWALKDVSFEVFPGEVVGIIGRNGAGKSTLLKILSRITEPTTGRLELYGRIASLLEVGTGFHPELTGRENIYLNGAILGMERSEIKQKFDEIVAFAEVEKFIDTPVKFYSSGMYVRLAFAVAAHLEPEVLVLDEVLAVGDTAFQKKCLGKMRDVSSHGRTVLLVSHSMATVGQLCKKSVWLDEGRIQAFGPSQAVIQSYLNSQQTKTAEYARDISKVQTIPSVFILGARVRNSESQIVSTLDGREPFSIEVEYSVTSRTLAWVGFAISTRDGAYVLSAADGDVDNYASEVRELGAYTSVCYIPAGIFNAQEYVLTLYACRTVGGGTEILDYLENVISFGIENPSGVGNLMPRRRVGVISPKLNWEMKSGTVVEPGEREIASEGIHE
ncbi:MAG TPA: ABC transporter ATP-binding protein [Pyrinomonadaceae bacterium]|nr:ABC transporter ATP-binding protein [Pyrinomonadaceae bacterium]